jgi:hypothetical protein
MISLNLPDQPDQTLLASIPNLAAVGRANRRFEPLPWPDMLTIDRADPLRVEWQNAMRE